MSNEEILAKAIAKAMDNGYDLPAGELYRSGFSTKEMIYSVIFDHDFAKAFWNDEASKCVLCGKFLCKCSSKHPKYYPGWQYYLQQMVLEEDPIQYLEKFI